MPIPNAESKGFLDGVSVDVRYSEVIVVVAFEKYAVLPVAHFMDNFFFLDPGVIYGYIPP